MPSGLYVGAVQTYHLFEPQPPPHGAAASPPDIALAPESGTLTGSAVVHIAVHREAPGVFAVVMDMGCVAVFCAERRTPACMWTCPADAVAAAWLPGAPSSLAVVSAAGLVTVYDVAADPCQHQTVQVAVPLRGGCTCVAAALAGANGTGQSGDDSDGSGGGGNAVSGPAVLVLLLSDGSCVAQVLGGNGGSGVDARRMHEHLLGAS